MIESEFIFQSTNFSQGQITSGFGWFLKCGFHFLSNKFVLWNNITMTVVEIHGEE